MADWGGMGGSTDSLAFMARAAMAAFSLSSISLPRAFSLCFAPLILGGFSGDLEDEGDRITGKGGKWGGRALAFQLEFRLK